MKINLFPNRIPQTGDNKIIYSGYKKLNEFVNKV